MAAAFALAGTAAVAQAPARVVSINLCTDQLALLLAAPGQIVSLSHRAQDARLSMMAEEAATYPTNGSEAEEVYLLRPDLVLAGTFNSPATIRMLRRLGVDVVQFAPETRLSDIAANLRRMGKVLGRAAEGAAAARAFEARLAALSRAPIRRPRAALYYVNAYTPGAASLDGDLLRRAGFDNVADAAGLSLGGTLPLERLVLLAPEIVIRGRDYPGQSRGEAVLTHPALTHLNLIELDAHLAARGWTCGLPQTLDALEALVALRERLEHAP